MQGEPLQYLTGIAGFRLVELAVGPGVFIPRPETELVAGCAIEHLPAGGTLVDVGTGSGAIALSVARERPDARVLATERDPDALRWAERNRAALAPDVAIVPGELFDCLPGDLEGSVDVIVSNPPYVATSERSRLPVDVVEHEPASALFAGGDGLDVFRRLIPSSPRWLRSGGWLVVEIGETQSQPVSALFIASGFVDVAVHEDLAGRLRYVDGRLV